MKKISETLIIKSLAGFEGWRDPHKNYSNKFYTTNLNPNYLFK